MAYTYELPNISNQGFDTAIVGIATAVPAFTPVFLFSIYLMIILGGMVAQRNKEGYYSFAMWSTLGSLATLMISLGLTRIEGIITPTMLLVNIVVVLLSGIALFFPEDIF